MAKTHYDYLGVKSNATLEEIKSAYRKLQLRCHPDKTCSLPAHERSRLESLSKSVNNAYELLRDSSRRREYDFACGFASPFKSHEPSFKSNRSQARPAWAGCPHSQYSTDSVGQDRTPPPGHIQPNSKIFEERAYGWVFELQMSSRFKSNDWCETATFFGEHHVTILIKVSPRDNVTPVKEQDVRMIFQRTPGQRRPSAYQSIYMQRVEEGVVERSVVIQVRLDPNPNKLMMLGYEFRWDLEATQKMPSNPTATMASCVEYHRDMPKDLYGPERTLKSNCHLQPCRLTDLGPQRCGKVRFGPDFSMIRIAAVGMQHTAA